MSAAMGERNSINTTILIEPWMKSNFKDSFYKDAANTGIEQQLLFFDSIAIEQSVEVLLPYYHPSNPCNLTYIFLKPCRLNNALLNCIGIGIPKQAFVIRKQKAYNLRIQLLTLMGRHRHIA